MMIKLDAMRVRLRSLGYPRGPLYQVAIWRKNLVESRANFAIEGMGLDAEDEALFEMVLDEGLLPAAIVEVIHSLSSKLDRTC